MSEWIQGGYDGLFYLGEKGTKGYRGYVVRTVEDNDSAVWFAYLFTSGEHTWFSEGSEEKVKRALEQHKEPARYPVDTYTYACTAYVRTTLRRGLALQPQENVWAGTEFVNAARGMVAGPDMLPDEHTWELTKTELTTIHRALEWRQARRKAGKADVSTRHEILTEWSFIEAGIRKVLREVWHSEGKYWM